MQGKISLSLLSCADSVSFLHLVGPSRRKSQGELLLPFQSRHSAPYTLFDKRSIGRSLCWHAEGLAGFYTCLHFCRYIQEGRQEVVRKPLLMLSLRSVVRDVRRDKAVRSQAVALLLQDLSPVTRATATMGTTGDAALLLFRKFAETRLGHAYVPASLIPTVRDCLRLVA